MEALIFEDRRDAGRQLAARISQRRYVKESPLILGIPRGGMVVAAEVAEALSAPLDVVIARKIRAPYQPELGIGAVVDGTHITVLNEELVRTVGASKDYLDREIAYQSREVDRRLQLYRGDRPGTEVLGKTVIIVDDGIATGYTFRAALEGLRQRKPLRLVAAAPVGARDTAKMLAAFADELICLSTPFNFMAVGQWYRNFDQVSDEEVVAILQHNWSREKNRRSEVS
jgi:putative phosphoribosyl transferase